MAEDARTLHVHQGMTYRATFSWLTNGTTPVPISLAGYVVDFVILKRAGKLPPLLAVSSSVAFTALGGGIEVQPGGAVGTLRITLTALQTGALKRSAFYNLSVRPGAIEPVEYVASGPLTLILEGN